MERRYLGGSSQRFPIPVLTGVLGSGKEMFGTARARREDPSSLDPEDDAIQQGALA